jgi:SAM-dependent methyltransferase
MASTSSSITPAPHRALWQKGDFGEIAAFMRTSGEAVVASLGIAPGMRVMDLGCGDGTTAVPLARAGAEVTGVDLNPAMVAAGNRRAAEAGLGRLHFEEGDAGGLERIGDHTFDLSLSMFGAMFAPQPFEAARELVRVTKPGGRVVMGNWIPADPTFVSELLRVSSAFTPPPPEGFVSPMLWGVPERNLERFGRAGVAPERVTMAKDTYYFTHPEKTPADFIDLFERFYGPTMVAVESARRSGKAEQMHEQLVALAEAHNKSRGGTLIPATFLRVTVQL